MGRHYQDGFYAARVLCHGFEKAKSGKNMVCIDIQPVSRLENCGFENEQAFAIEPGLPAGIVRCVVIPDNSKSMNMLMAKLRYAGFEGDDFSKLNLDGQVVRVKCSGNKFDGEDGPVIVDQWDLCLPPRQKAERTADPSIANELNNLLDKQLAEVKVEKAPAVPEAAGVHAEATGPLSGDAFKQSPNTVSGSVIGSEPPPWLTGDEQGGF